MPRQLWREGSASRWPTLRRAGEYKEFSVLGERFLFQPDDLRLFALEHQELLPAAPEMVAVPQFALPAIQPRMLVLLPTLACNLRCRYCFEAAAEDAGRVRETEGNAEDNITSNDTGKTGCRAVMPRSVWRRALDLIPAGAEAGLCFFGGEPLLAFEVVREAALAARERYRTVKFSLTTNGTLLTPEIVSFLADERFSLIVSLDGPPHLHDAARPDAGGRGTYAAILGGLERIARHPQLAARVTLRATFDGSGRYAHLLDRVRHLNQLCRQFGLGGVSVEPADLSEGCARGGMPVVASEALYEEYLDTAEWIARERDAGRRAHLHHFDVRLRRLFNREPAPAECGAGAGYLTITPEGEVHACHRLGCAVGHLDRGGADARLQQPWRDNRYYARTGCAECWLRNVCGGGCRVNSLHCCNAINQPEPFGCWLTEVCTKCAAYLLSRSRRESRRMIASRTEEEVGSAERNPALSGGEGNQ